MLEIAKLLNLALKVFKTDDNEIVIGDNDKTNKTVVNLSKNLMYMLNIGTIKKPIFLTPNAKKIFNYLREIFIKAIILQYFNLKSHIQIKTDVLGYAIGKVLS